MNRKPQKGWLKHADFILLDLVCFQLSYTLAYWLVSGTGNPYAAFSYRYLAVVFAVGQLFTILFTNNYNGILRRGKLRELISVLQYTFCIMIFSLIFLFIVHESTTVSRLQFGWTLVIYVVLDYCLRMLNGRRIRHYNARTAEKKGRSLVVVTSGALVDDAIHKLLNTENGLYQGYFISGIILMDDDIESVKDKYDIPIIPLDDNAMARLRSRWVDEVFILQPSDRLVDKELFNDLADMGITVHFTLDLLNDDSWPPLQMRKLGAYKVMTTSISFITFNQALIKRITDIIGAIVGCIITGILFIFVAPAIYLKSPGPIFFKQKRVGLNGKVFEMYKFRSMYLDAEERKAALMEQNKIEGGLMFKMDDDPRIIGSEQKDKNGKPRGIGNFIRKTSIDEFPQFFNVLKGDMSLVGTRPPTLEEFEKYDIHHRARMTTKPGITGLWQVSGRSQITDFEEVVRLDRDYIENWSMALDFKILVKTVLVVLRGRGAE